MDSACPRFGAGDETWGVSLDDQMSDEGDPGSGLNCLGQVLCKYTLGNGPLF